MKFIIISKVVLPQCAFCVFIISFIVDRSTEWGRERERDAVICLMYTAKQKIGTVNACTYILFLCVHNSQTTYNIVWQLNSNLHARKESSTLKEKKMLFVVKIKYTKFYWHFDLFFIFSVIFLSTSLSHHFVTNRKVHNKSNYFCICHE